jgi:hypothetical protein
MRAFVKSQNLLVFMIRTQQNAKQGGLRSRFILRFDIIIMSNSHRARRSPGTNPLSVNFGGWGVGDSHSVTMETDHWWDNSRNVWASQPTQPLMIHTPSLSYPIHFFHTWGWNFKELLRNKLRFTWGWAEVLSMDHIVQILNLAAWPDVISKSLLCECMRCAAYKVNLRLKHTQNDEKFRFSTAQYVYIHLSAAWSTERFIEDQAFSPSYDLAPPLPPPPSASCLSFSVFLCVAGRAYWRERLERMGRRRSKIIRRLESLVLFNSFNTLSSAVSRLQFPDLF